MGGRSQGGHAKQVAFSTAESDGLRNLSVSTNKYVIIRNVRKFPLLSTVDLFFVSWLLEELPRKAVKHSLEVGV